ncbi:MAG: PhzF family phenazine biosynthesis protein [Spirochaetales bacterium]|nr:PhzF family phenazine biosynthesis protein [Spirochaetales bacterium]
MKYRFHYVDAFTTKPFEGNPCAVFPEATGLSDEDMQNLAKETNLPETAFVFSSDQADFKVRYFTPRQEIPFAGHPTIATAFVLAREGYIPLTAGKITVRFEFNIGVLPVELRSSDSGMLEGAAMRQMPPEFGATLDFASQAHLLGLEAADVLPGVNAQVVSTGVPFLMVALRTPEAVKNAVMDRPGLKKLTENLPAKVLFVFCPRGFTSEGDTFARLLDPDNAGEDPFTGSATGCMGSFLYRYGLVNKNRLVCEQGHLLGRPGSGILELEGTPERITGITLFGKAVTSFTGEYNKASSEDRLSPGL